ncbi:MAG: hypothetical protein ABEJ31_15195 [Haloarculaceae archaeon]
MSSEDPGGAERNDVDSKQAQPARPAGGYGDGDGALAILSEPAGRAAIKRVTAAFAAVGVGVGLTLLFLGSVLSNNVYGGTGSGFSVSAANLIFMVALFGAGPVLAGAAGLSGAFEVSRDAADQYVLGFVSAAVGTVVMLFVASVFAAIVMNAFQFSDALVATIFVAIATGVVAAGTAWANNWAAAPA